MEPKGIEKYFGPVADELPSRVGSFIRNAILNNIPFDPVDFQHTMADLSQDEQCLAQTFLVDATKTLAMGAEGRPLWAQQQLENVIKLYFAVKNSGRQAKRQKLNQAAGQPSVVFSGRVAVGMVIVGCQDVAKNVNGIHVNYYGAGTPAQEQSQPNPVLVRPLPFLQQQLDPVQRPLKERAQKAGGSGRGGWRDEVAEHDQGLAISFGKNERRAESQFHKRAFEERGCWCSHRTDEPHGRARERSRSLSPWYQKEYGRGEHRHSHRRVQHSTPRVNELA